MVEKETSEDEKTDNWEILKLDFLLEVGKEVGRTVGKYFSCSAE